MSCCKSIGCARPVAFGHDFCLTCVATQPNYEELLNNPVSDGNLAGVLEANKAAVPAVISEPEKESKDSGEFSGGHVSYYTIDIGDPMNGDSPHRATCQDIIEALGMSFNEGTAFKAIWRKCAARLGMKKKGDDGGLYNAQKVQFAGERMVTEEKRKQHQALKSQD